MFYLILHARLTPLNKRLFIFKGLGAVAFYLSMAIGICSLIGTERFFKMRDFLHASTSVSSTLNRQNALGSGKPKVTKQDVLKDL